MHSARRPFLLFPWGTDFTGGLARLVLAEVRESHGPDVADLSQILAVFPLRRAGVRFRRALMADDSLPKPFLPPEICTYAELTARLASRLPGPDGRPRRARVVSVLDRAGLLHECVRDLSEESLGELAALQAGDPAVFFPWGVRLAKLMEELLLQGKDPANLEFLEGEVAPFPAALLAGLGTIFKAYVEGLERSGWTTPGLDARKLHDVLVSGEDAQVRDALAPVDGKRIILSGLFEPAGVQEVLCRTLWRERDGVVALFGDGKLAGPNPQAAHWSCGPMAELARRWGTSLEPAPEALAPRVDAPASITFCEGFDLHSQLHVLADALREEPARAADDDTVVVLPAAEALTPMLHNLPDKEVNVGMGYPLARSPLARLLESVFRARETMSEGLYHWKDCVECLRHPYIKMLQTAGGQSLRVVFRHLEERLRMGDAFVDPVAGLRLLDLDELVEGDVEEVRALAHETLDTCFGAFASMDSLAAAGWALQRLCLLMTGHAGEVWKRFPLDGECLHRLLYSVIPMLRDSAVSAMALPDAAVISIVRQCVEGETVPFESEHAEGLQLLSPGETRLARFRRVYVVDTVENRFPGRPGNDPLLPDPLRHLAGLPDSRNDERASAWAFFGLVRSAGEAHLLYQAGGASGGALLDDKPERSRFVEELLWERERERCAVISPGDAELPQAAYTLRAIPEIEAGVERTPAVGDAMEAFLRKPLSASSLDAYMTCPLRFVYERLCKVEEPEAVDEDGDPMALGTAVHKALQEFFLPWVGRDVAGELLDPDELARLFLVRLREEEFYGRMPLDSRILLERSGARRMRAYAANLSPTRIIELEQSWRGELDHGGVRCEFLGKVDRLDARETAEGSETFILDYKTGGVHGPSVSFWDDEPLWERMDAWEPGADPELLAEVAESCRSVQMPLYLWLHWQREEEAAHDAVWVKIRDNGKEKLLLGDKLDAAARDRILTRRIPALLGFLVRHMRQAPSFGVVASSRCRWCGYGRLCGEG